MPRTAILERWPETDSELHAFVWAVWGMNIPRKSVCADHDAPFDAFCDAYFGRSPVSIWKASRGLGGKSTLLGVLSITEAVCLNAHVTVLGGSAQQSQRVHEVTHEAWYEPLAPKYLLARDPTNFYTHFTTGAWIRALMASQTSVRGPHPQRLRLDEIDEMSLQILEAAQGQPMEKVMAGKLVESQTVMSSTHQYPDGTMTEMLKRATKQPDWRVFQWCYRESRGTDDEPGWLSDRQIARKKSEINEHMWATEFELQEPSFAGRIFQPDHLDRFFGLGNPVPGDDDTLYVFEDPDPNKVRMNRYCTGIDWAKETDWTIATVYDTTTFPWRRVAWRRLGRAPWPVIIAKVQTVLDRYKGWLVHDDTGIGNVINDLIAHERRRMLPVSMIGVRRTEMFNDYVKAVEEGQLSSPMIQYAYDETKYTTLEDLFGRGHPPDSVVADALAWHGRFMVIRPGPLQPMSLTRQGMGQETVEEHFANPEAEGEQYFNNGRDDTTDVLSILNS